jgi:hypothetical protein
MKLKSGWGFKSGSGRVAKSEGGDASSLRRLDTL